MEFILEMSPWLMALVIFALRIVDVSIGTLRTIFVVQGRLKASVFLGFVEVLIWITAISQIIVAVKDNPVVILGWALGFAAGNALGMLIERKLALGKVMIQLISPKAGPKIAEGLRCAGRRLTTFSGEGLHGPVTMILAICDRKELPRILAAARQEDPEVFYAVEPVREASAGLGRPLPHATGWRAVFKKK